MRSPNFPQRAAEIAKVLNPKTLRVTWTDYLRNKLRRSIVADPIENLDTHLNIAGVAQLLSQRIAAGTYLPDAPQRMLMEKSKGLCRQVVLPHAEDALILQCLFQAFYHDLKGKAPTKNAFFEPDQAFASKALADGTRYGSLHSWKNFQKKIFNFIGTHSFIVVTDIANYYDFISYEHLRHSISGSIAIREPILDLMLYTLSGMLWQPDYMQRVPIGLPQIDLDAPRVLAHCLLYELDTFLMAQPDTEFARFMDDIDIGVQTLAAAKRVVREVDLSLQTKQLRLNSGKTTILTADAARRYFRLRENILIDRLQLDWAKGNRRRNLKALANFAYKRGSFDGPGNGDKILNRIVRLATSQRARLSDALIEDALYSRPSVRAAALDHISTLGCRLSDLRLILKLLNDQAIVDDATFIRLANALVATPMRISEAHRRLLSKIVSRFDNEQYFQAYAKLWTYSKIGRVDQLMSLLKQTQSVWRVDRTLGRLAGGMAPRFLAERAGNLQQLEDFDHVVKSSLNRDAIGVYQFHLDIGEREGFYEKVKPFVNAPNSSSPLGVSHPKFLLLLSCLSSNRVSPEERIRLLGRHGKLSADDYYSFHVAGAQRAAEHPYL